MWERKLFIFKYRSGEIQQRKRLLDLAHNPAWLTNSKESHREKEMKEKEIERNMTDKIHEETNEKGCFNQNWKLKIIYSPTCHSKPVWLSYFCGIQHLSLFILKNVLIVIICAIKINWNWSSTIKTDTKWSYNYIKNGPSHSCASSSPLKLCVMNKPKLKLLNLLLQLDQRVQFMNESCLSAQMNNL